MVVAVVTVRVMELTRHEIVQVVAVWDSFMATPCAVLVLRLIATRMPWRTALGILSGDGDAVIINVIAVDVMHVPIV